MSDNINVLLVGCGYMGTEYAKAFKDLKINLTVVGNSEEGTKKFSEETGMTAIPGGLSEYLTKQPCQCETAVLATPITRIAGNAIELIKKGYKKILIEKPAGLDENDLEKICDVATEADAEVYVAYNRRFYAATKKAMDIIAKDGGVTSFNFEFTEWADSVENSENTESVLGNWLFANSSHVIDLAFFLGGHPVEMTSFVEGSFSWHKNGAIYSGAGKTDKGALFSYQANWKAPGRWGVEVLTEKHRLIFRPLEKLQCQNLNSVAIEEVEIDDEMDRKYKPGIYAEVEAFLFGVGAEKLLTIQDALKMIPIYEKIAGVNKQ